MDALEGPRGPHYWTGRIWMHGVQPSQLDHCEISLQA